MATGWYESQEEEWDRTRHLMAFILNYSGMGMSGKTYSPQEVLSLSKDNSNVITYINSDIKAYKLLERFKING